MSPTGIFIADAVNWDDEANDGDALSGGDSTYDTGSDGAIVYARWTPSAAPPVPGPGLLLGLGLLVMGVRILREA